MMAAMAAILKIYFSLPELKGQLTPNLVGNIRVTCRSKIAKILLMGNPMAAMVAILKIFFSLVLLNPKAN